MSATSPPTGGQGPHASSSRVSLRLLGILLLVMFLVTSVVGGSLALESSYVLVTLASHIGLALVTLGLAGYATSFVGRSYKAMPRGFAGVCAVSALGATIAGTIFLLDGQSTGALSAMEAFAVIGILAALVMVAFGGASQRRVSAVAVS